VMPALALEVVLYSLIIQCAVLHLDPSAIKKTYLSGFIGSFEMARDKTAARIIREASTSKEIQYITQGLQRHHDKYNPKSGRVKLPFCMDMALEAREDLTLFAFPRVQTNSVIHSVMALRIFVCMAIGIMFMLRKSEHFGSGDKEQISRRGFTFFDEHDHIISYNRIGIMLAHRVAINVSFSKADSSGYGRRTQHSRQDGVEQACIVQILEHWFSYTRDEYGATEDNTLYEVPGLASFKLNDLHCVMATTAQRMGLHKDASTPTSHSLRYGGATMMAAAGFPQYLIAQYGGWSEKSSSLKIYTKASAAMIQQVSKHMAEMSRLDVSKIFLIDATIRNQGKARTHDGRGEA